MMVVVIMRALERRVKPSRRCHSLPPPLLSLPHRRWSAQPTQSHAARKDGGGGASP
jgi:hypothetical protein